MLRRRRLNGHELEGTRDLVHARWDDDDDMCAGEADDHTIVLGLVIIGTIAAGTLVVLGIVGLIVWGFVEVLTP